MSYDGKQRRPWVSPEVRKIDAGSAENGKKTVCDKTGGTCSGQNGNNFS